MHASGRFHFLRHVLKMRSYKIIFVDDVTSWIREGDAICFTYPSFMFFEIFMFSAARNYVLRRDFNFRFIHERMFGRSWMIILRLFSRLFLRLKQSAREVAFSVLGFVLR